MLARVLFTTCVCVTLGYGSPIMADDTAVITGGFLSSGTSHGGHWMMESASPSFSLSGSHGVGNFPNDVYAPGDPIRTHGEVTSSDIYGGPGEVNGVHSDFYSLGGNTYGSGFFFDTAPMLAQAGVHRLPFTFHGYLSAAPHSSDQCVICMLPVTGSGLATLTFVQYVPGGSDLELSSIRYDFAAVPEPSTVLMLALPMAGLIGWRLRTKPPSRAHWS